MTITEGPPRFDSASALLCCRDLCVCSLNRLGGWKRGYQLLEIGGAMTGFKFTF